jgi:hypothetical protein
MKDALTIAEFGVPIDPHSTIKPAGPAELEPGHAALGHAGLV